MNLKGRSALVTGGAGFIGSELSRQLKEAGARVVIVDNLVNGKRRNVESILDDACRLETVDIRDQQRLAELLSGVDFVFHLACLGVRHSIHSPLENHEVNATATLNLLKLARAASVRRFVYVSSSEIYGTARSVPMPEEHPPFPMTVYGSSKLAGECYTRAYFETYGFPTVVIRPFNTYGPNCHHEGDSGEVIPKFLLRGMAGKPMIIFGDGAQTRDFTFVSDTARGIWQVGLAEGAVGETINIGSGFEITVNDLANQIAAVLGQKTPNVQHDQPRPGDVLRLYADTTKACKRFGFQPTIPLRDGLERLKQFYLQSGESIEKLLEQEVVRNWESGRSPAPASGAIPVARPLLGEEEAQAARRPILSGWVTQGPEVEAFEREFASWTGAPNACAVSSATTALHLALLSLGVGPGDEVITVSHSFIATANSIRYCGAQPVFIDIERRTFNLDPGLLEKAITSKTRAILCVHQIGMPCDLASILKIARRHNLPVIEDAACAIGSELFWEGRWERVGKPHADIACFSFHPRKVVTTGDGGMLTTRNADWAEQFRKRRQHSMSLSDRARHGSNQVVFEEYPEVGFNYRMTDIQAAIGREQLRRLPSILSKRRELAARYAARLAEIPGLELPFEPEWARSNWQSYCVRLPSGAAQTHVMQRMLDAGISTRRGVMCAHREGAYRDASRRGPLVESEQATDQCIILPLFTQMTEADQDRVVEELKKALGG